jgi:hypothetical protein
MGDPEPVYQEVGLDTPAPSRRKRRSKRHASTRQLRRRMRLVYFSLAALWGFLTGSGAVFVGLSATGRQIPLGRSGALVLVAAAVLALLGGGVVAAGYRAASRRYH